MIRNIIKTTTNYMFHLIFLTFFYGDSFAVTHFNTSVLSVCQAAAPLFFVVAVDALVVVGFLSSFFFWSGAGSGNTASKLLCYKYSSILSDSIFARIASLGSFIPINKPVIYLIT